MKGEGSMTAPGVPPSAPPGPPATPPVPPAPPGLPPYPPAPPDTNRAITGPMALLLGLGVAILMSTTFRRQMGDVACAWRVSYSPAGRAFAIWGVIFAWMLASVVEQLLVAIELDNVYAAAPENNTLMGGGLFMAGLWVVAFGYARREDQRGGLVVSTSFLLASTWCGVGACVQELSWRGLDPMRILFVGVPFSLFAGWMCVASALGAGVTILALRHPPDYLCQNEGDPTNAAGYGSWVPLLLSVPLCALALGVPDPVLPLPLAWGIAHMRGHWKNRVAMALLLGSSAGAVVFAVFGVWVV